MTHRGWKAIAVVMVGLTSRAMAEDAEDRAAEAIEQCRGRVWRDNTTPEKLVVEVGLYSSSIKDGDLRALAGLKYLRGLQIVGTDVTDAGLKEIAKVTSLESLQLTATSVTNAGMKNLLPLTNLRMLSLWSTAIGNDGLKNVAQISGLTELYLCGTYVGDDGLKELVQLKSLTELSLSHTAVTDAALNDLARLKSLKSLNVEFTHLTEAGVAELRKALPDCHIVYYRPKADSTLTILQLTGRGNVGTVVGLTPFEMMGVEPEKLTQLKNRFLLERVETQSTGDVSEDVQTVERLLFSAVSSNRVIELPLWLKK